MTARDTMARASRATQQQSARSTGRKYHDNNLVQEVDIDEGYSRTLTHVERIQPIGVSVRPLNQREGTQKKSQSSSSGGTDRFSDNQPDGPSAEHFVNYIGGDPSHPVVIASDDRTTRTYNHKEGDTAFYHAAGSEQMVLMNDAGAHLISLDGKSVKNPKGNETRYASLRHVTKDMQSHKIDEENSEKEVDYKHEGKSVNTEVRCTASRIEFRTGDTVVGYYDKSSETWFLKGKIVALDGSDRVETVGKTYLGLDTKGEDATYKVEGIKDAESKITEKVFIKGTLPAPPD